jgi:hypothetical protein
MNARKRKMAVYAKTFDKDRNLFFKLMGQALS